MGSGDGNVHIRAAESNSRKPRVIKSKVINPSKSQFNFKCERIQSPTTGDVLTGGDKASEFITTF